jgi:hypothetical protein
VWVVIRLELAGGNPSLAKKIRRDCTYTEVAEAWQIDRRKALALATGLNKKGGKRNGWHE